MLAFVTQLGAAIVGLLVAMGLILLVVGLRGTLTLHDPRCAACRYDLRTYGDRPGACPECGADLSAPTAIRFDERRPRRLLVHLGITSLCLAVAVPFVDRAIAARGGPAMTPGAANAPAIVAPGQAAPPRVRVADLDDGQFLAALREARARQGSATWVELGKRLESGGLTSDQKDEALAAMIELFKSSRGDDAGQARGWCSRAIAALLKSGDLDDAQVIALASAWLGEASLQPMGRLESTMPVPVRVQAMPDAGTTAPFRRVARIRGVRVDGEPMEWVEATAESGPSRRGRRALGQALPPLAPGTHHVDVDVEWVLMMVEGPPRESRDDPFASNDELPDPAGTPWRRLARGNEVVGGDVVVVGPGEPLHVGFVEEGKRQAVAEGVRVNRATLQAGQQEGEEELDVLLDVTPVPGVPLLMRVVVLVDGQRLVGDPFVAIAERPAGRSSGATSTSFIGAPALTATIKSLPADVLAVEVLLEPALDDREHLDPRFERVWGEAIPLGPVRIERLAR